MWNDASNLRPRIGDDFIPVADDLSPVATSAQQDRVRPPVISQARRWWTRSRAWISILIIVPFAWLMLISVPLVVEGTWDELVLELIGWFCFLAGVAIRWWATLYIGGRKYHELVVDGPYSLCRNPLYAGTFLLGLSIALMLGSATFATGYVIAACVYLVITVPVEEADLRARLGVEFDMYCEHVPRFWPLFRRPQTARMIEVDTQGLMAEARRAARYFWIPTVCHIVLFLRAEGLWPQILHLP